MESLGLNNQLIDWIVNKLGKSVNPVKVRLTEAQTEVVILQESISKHVVAIQNLKKEGEANDGLKIQLEE